MKSCFFFFHANTHTHVLLSRFKHERFITQKGTYFCIYFFVITRLLRGQGCLCSHVSALNKVDGDESPLITPTPQPSPPPLLSFDPQTSQLWRINFKLLFTRRQGQTWKLDFFFFSTRLPVFFRLLFFLYFSIISLSASKCSECLFDWVCIYVVVLFLATPPPQNPCLLFFP